MDRLFRLTAAQRHNPKVDEWLSGEPYELYAIARHCFTQIRSCGDDVLELLHDGCPTACVGEGAFAYVNVFKSHVNVGFFTGAMLSDTQNLLEGSGKRMRHVQIKPGEEPESLALTAIIKQAYEDIKSRLDRE